MVRDMETFYPRKDDMGNGPIELVLGNVLDKVSQGTHPPTHLPARPPHVPSNFTAVLAHGDRVATVDFCCR